MTEKINIADVGPDISLGVIAWNEEDSIGGCLESLFRQSIFAKLKQRNLTCEVLCLANGCSDATAEVAAKIFHAQGNEHPFKDSFTCRVVNLAERGKLNAWNVFVHKLSAPTAEFLFLMDGDIAIHHHDTLWNMLAVLLDNRQAVIAVDHPLKDISFKAKPSVLEKISLATSAMTQAGAAQVTGQLYCIRAASARNIYLPRDLAACEDGFIKALICTDFLTRPALPARIVRATDASHIFEAYSSIGDILKNQKRQMIGQTIVHVLVDKYLKSAMLGQRMHLGEFLSGLERNDPIWLKRLIKEHLRTLNHCWELFPGLLSFRFRRLDHLRGTRWVLNLPVALIGFVAGLICSRLAFIALKKGCTNYWPDTKSLHLAQHVSPKERCTNRVTNLKTS